MASFRVLLTGFLAGAAGLLLAFGAIAQEPGFPVPAATHADMKISPADHVLGQADAPVTVVEYASLTCPHCAAFALTMLPAIRKEFIETGIVRLVYRDFPLDRLALAAAQIARCGGRERYFPLIEALFASQHRWLRDADPLSALARIAMQHGLAPGEIRQCLADSRVEEAVLQQRLEGERSFGVKSTPTLFIAGESYGGGLTIAQFRAIVGRPRPPR